MRLLAISPAAESTSNASASCLATRASLARRERRPALCRGSDRSARSNSTRELMIAGARAKLSVAMPVIPTAPTSAVAFTRISSSRGTPAGANATNIRTAPAARAARTPEERGQLVPRVDGRPSDREPPDDVQVLGDRGRDDRCPEVGAPRVVQPLRHHADDRVRDTIVVGHDLASEYVGV